MWSPLAVPSAAGSNVHRSKTEMLREREVQRDTPMNRTENFSFRPSMLHFRGKTKI